MQLISFVVIFLGLINYGYSQSCGTNNLQLRSEIASTCQTMTMSMLHDVNGKPYLYVANKESGLKIYDLSNLSTPVLKKSIPINELNNLEVMSVTQTGDYLYLATGNTFNNNQSSGMAIVNVSNPENALVTDTYVLPGSQGGSGIIVSDNQYAYLGAMGNGVVILNVQNKSNIQQIAVLVPPISFPNPTNPDPAKYNARGMQLVNNLLYLCYDAGGLRIIDVTDKQNPKECGRYSNPLLYNKPRAYNNVIVKDTLAYITADYCGLEVLNIKDTSNITMIGWWNPYNCPNNNWFSSPVHANEIAINEACKTLFLSTGKSDLMVIDISDPTHPDSCNFYGGISNNIGSWGVSTYQNQVFLSYVCSIIPFSSNWTGVKVLEYTPCQASGTQFIKAPGGITINRSGNKLMILSPEKIEKIELLDNSGRLIYGLSQITGNQAEITLRSNLPPVFIIQVTGNKSIYTKQYFWIENQ